MYLETYGTICWVIICELEKVQKEYNGVKVQVDSPGLVRRKKSTMFCDRNVLIGNKENIFIEFISSYKLLSILIQLASHEIDLLSRIQAFKKTRWIPNKMHSIIDTSLEKFVF